MSWEAERMKTGARLVAVATVAAILTATAGGHVLAQTEAAPEANAVEAAPAEAHVGLVCMWALYATIAEIGRRCGVTADPAALTATDREVARMEAYARTQSPGAAAFMERYKQSHIIGNPQLCSSDLVIAFRGAPRDASEAIAKARRDIDALLARSPPVDVGDTCV
jgi:hypothetical protein